MVTSLKSIKGVMQKQAGVSKTPEKLSTVATKGKPTTIPDPMFALKFIRQVGANPHFLFVATRYSDLLQQDSHPVSVFTNLHYAKAQDVTAVLKGAVLGGERKLGSKNNPATTVHINTENLEYVIKFGFYTDADEGIVKDPDKNWNPLRQPTNYYESEAELLRHILSFSRAASNEDIKQLLYTLYVKISKTGWGA